MPVAVWAQEDDRSRLTRFLEEQFSDDGNRDVRIEGFRGALSSEARLDRLTISDAEGVWLILEDAVLDWNRSAVLRGSIEIDELSAARLEILRPPLPSEGVDLPDVEAQPFSLPELPVSVDIGEVSINEVVLGEPVIGIAARLTIQGSASLSGGEGQAQITLNRLDGAQGQFELNASYDNATRNLALDLLLVEEENGLVAELIGLPGRPDLRLQIAGEGPVDDFTAEIALATDGRDRITGTVISARSDAGEQLIVADIGGDISPLLLPDYREFFGNDVQLQAQVRQTLSGGVELEALRLTSAALTLEGDLAINGQGLPERVNLTGEIRPPNGNVVRLPSGGADARISGASLALVYDRNDGDEYALTADLDNLAIDDLSIAGAALSLEGAVALTSAGIEAATANFNTALNGVEHADPAMAEALGGTLGISAQMSWVTNAPVILSDLSVVAGDVTLEGGASGQTVGEEISVGLDLTASIGALERFAAIAGQPLAGSAALTVSGQVKPLSGQFDLTIGGTGNDMQFVDGLPPELFAGETRLAAQVVRDTEGLQAQAIRLDNAELTLTGAASLSSGDTSASVQFALEDVGLFTDVMSGPVTIAADVAREGTAPFDVTATLSGPNEIAADISGTFDAETTDFALDLDASARDLNLGDAIPAGLTAGRTTLTATATRRDGVLDLQDLTLSNGALNVNGTAQIGPNSSRADVNARLANVGLFTDALSGPVSADAMITREGTGPWNIDADLGGPGGMQASVNGEVGRPDGSVNITATGTAPLALANRFIRPRSIRGTLSFNLAMRGQPGLGAVSGTLSSGNTRIAVPTYALAIENVGLNGQVSGGRLSLNANGTLSTGGQVTAAGSINLASPGLDGQINVGLRDARLVDPTLYDARIETADLTVSGPIARRPQISGTVTLGESEIRVPEASLAGSAAIPDIRHLGETPAERQTRRFAGLLGGRGSGGGRGSATTGLDITVNAPGRIFLRGRGIDAEFGGTLRIFGTAANVIPTGQFELIRGRLSILGTRLDFIDSSVTLQGSFNPYLRLTAVSMASGYQVIVRMTGPISGPEISFSSNPALPEDEVLAQLLFGRSVSGLSPLQLLQLADAATSLAGGSTNSGFIAELRDGLGLDDLDLSTDAEGNAAVTAGRYLSENIYTDVTINAEGEADLSLNIDLTPNITARGSVGSGGGSSIGIFFEQDY
ncbi:translocation/assembly module TamB domain-containing protein [Hasllibacter sp. MH4015]|uniref:translocation/assembly module TamB domain-containing protein n=1 Tax=Hasllibacter sp. MH4015 TaxID=2854029 RepID=UPI001CD6C627|nr:translocation/assembly module TamB domain-containing protein [Hasllibacter sp. MH4015]